MGTGSAPPYGEAGSGTASPEQHPTLLITQPLSTNCRACLAWRPGSKALCELHLLAGCIVTWLGCIDQYYLQGAAWNVTTVPRPTSSPTFRPTGPAAGWGDKPGVRIVFGRWQDVLPELGQYDGIFFDTYGEYYEDLRYDNADR